MEIDITKEITNMTLILESNEYVPIRVPLSPAQIIGIKAILGLKINFLGNDEYDVLTYEDKDILNSIEYLKKL